MRVEKEKWGTKKWFVCGSNHSAAFVHINRHQMMTLDSDDTIDCSIYIERGTCKVETLDSSLILLEGSTLHVPQTMSVSIEAITDVDMLQICSLKNKEVL